MEQIERQLPAWNKYTSDDDEVGPATEEPVMSFANFNEMDVIGNESAYYEKFLLDDFDNYFDEINDRLTVSRLVSNSVIKGIVNAVVDETEEKVVSKDAEIASLKERLRASNYVSATVNRSELSTAILEHSKLSMDGVPTKSFLGMNYVNERDDWVFAEHSGPIKIVVENQFHTLKDDIDFARNLNSHGLSNKAVFRLLPCRRMDELLQLLSKRVDCLRVMLVGIFEEVNDACISMNVSAMERHWEQELHEEINAIVLRNFVRDIQEDYETKIYEQRKLINAQSMNFQQKVSELSSIREDLDAISKSLSNSDQSLLLSHSSSESLEELNNSKRKDQFHLKSLGNNHSSFALHSVENGASTTHETLEFGKSVLENFDFPHLKHLSKEDLVAYYKTEMAKMRWQHDKAMEEKTDELFKLKREFLREKGSLLLKKDKELEHLKKNVRRIVSNLEDILTEKKVLSVVNDDSNEFYSLKNKINSMFFENQKLQGLLKAKRNEVDCLSAQITEAESQILLNTKVNKNLSEMIAKLRCDIKDLNAEIAVKEELDVIISKEAMTNLHFQTYDTEMETKLIHDIYSIFIKESTRNALLMINEVASNKQAEKAYFESLLLEKESALRSEIEEGEELKLKMVSLSELISEKVKAELKAESTIMQQKEKFCLVNHELDMLRDEVNKQRLIISGNKIHSDFMRSQFEEALQQLQVYELEIDNLNQKLAISSSSLEESERQKNFLNEIVKERENELSISINDENNDGVQQVEAMVSSWKTFSVASLDFENRLSGIIKRNESRIRVLSNQCSSLKRQVNLLLQKGFWYKRMFEIRDSNLQKAEAEVDLLGDEVDALLSVIGKVYVALDHYSPVLQHYPGVMEILKLVRKELQGETALSR